jgi:hypothetical protein
MKNANTISHTVALQFLEKVSFGKRARSNALTKPAVRIEGGSGEVAAKVVALVPVTLDRSAITAKSTKERKD